MSRGTAYMETGQCPQATLDAESVLDMEPVTADGVHTHAEAHVTLANCSALEGTTRPPSAMPRQPAPSPMGTDTPTTGSWPFAGSRRVYRPPWTEGYCRRTCYLDLPWMTPGTAGSSPPFPGWSTA